MTLASASSSPIGFGASGAWGMNWHPREKALSMIALAIEHGVGFFDTAPFYGDGEAERRLGDALKGQTAITISTKTGTYWVRPGKAQKDFSAEAISRQVDASLKRLRKEQIDILYLHGPTIEEIDQSQHILTDLKRVGKIAKSGVCGTGGPLQHAVECGFIDSIMGVYNFLEQDHAAIFAAAKRRDLHVTAIAPLAQALYAPDFFKVRSMADGWRLARALVKNRPQLRRARNARRILETSQQWTPIQLAMGFCLANVDIDIALTTSTKPAHLLEALSKQAETPPPELLARLLAL